MFRIPASNSVLRPIVGVLLLGIISCSDDAAPIVSPSPAPAPVSRNNVEPGGKTEKPTKLEWKQYTASDRSYVVDLPGLPRETATESRKGSVKHNLDVAAGADRYHIEWYEISVIKVMPAAKKREALKRSAKAMRATNVRDVDVGDVGIEFETSIAGVPQLCRAAIFGERLYQLQASVSGSNEANAKSFLASFKPQDPGLPTVPVDDVWQDDRYWDTSQLLTEVKAVWISPDGAQGWAVAKDGCLLQLVGTNGQKRWRRYISPIPLPLKELDDIYTLHVSDDGTKGWAVGGRGMLLELDERGHWIPRRAPSDVSPHIGSAWLSDDRQSGWACRNDGSMLHLVSQGDSRRWDIHEASVRLKKTPPRSLWVAADGSMGWAVCDKGKILRLDGDTDRKWSLHSPSSGATENNLGAMWVAADGTDGWAIGAMGIVLRLVGSGEAQHWERHQLSTDACEVRLTSLWVKDDGSDGWAVGEKGLILRLTGTGDGQKWSVHQPSIAATKLRITAIGVSADGAHGWAFAKDYTSETQVLSLVGDDSMRHWELAQSDNAPQNFRRLWLTSEGSEGWVLPASNRPTRFHQGEMNIKPVNVFDSIRSIMGFWIGDDQRQGWGVGSMGSIAQLLVEGDKQVWKPHVSSGQATTMSLNAVHCSADGTAGWAVGHKGTILRLVGAGAEQTWELDESSSGVTDQNLWTVWISADGRSGWAGGNDGTFLRLTEVGGESRWQVHAPSSLGTNRRIMSLWVAADGSTGWAVGSTGSVFDLHSLVARLTGSGNDQRWEVDKPSIGVSKSMLMSVWAAADGNDGWAVGSDGAILRLTESESSMRWKRHHPSVNVGVMLNSVKMSDDGQSGWVVGDDGVILSLQRGVKKE